MTGRLVALSAAAALLVGCGAGTGGPKTRDAWLAQHGAAVSDVGTALDKVAAATKDGEPVGIRTSCEGLRDTTQEARDLPAVPDGPTDAALRDALDAITTGVADCVRAMGTGDARLLEKSITELRNARLKLDTANARLNA